MQQSQEIDNTNKLTFINVFKSCLDVLRNEGITGGKALKNLSNLLILKLLEPHFGRDIDIDNYENYNFGDSEDEIKYKTDLLEVARFSILANEKEEDINTNIRHLWKEILEVHPATKNIFCEGKTFDIKRGSNYKKIIDKLIKLDLSKNEHDILGSAYEEVIQDVMVGRELGQYFTPLNVKNIMIKLIKPKILPDGKIETCADPTMGTGGFLISYLKNIMQQAREKNINLDWDFIKNEGLYGKEIEPDTYQMAVSNMLISSGHMFDKLDNGDSVRDPILRKFDNILANPPFGIKGIKYEEIKNITIEINGENKTITRDEYIPLKTNRAVPLFLQIVISMLKLKGKCAIVLPNGEDLYSKSKILVQVREYLMKTCNLKKVIHLPSKIFTNTSISTCILYFIKKRESEKVIIKKSKKIVLSKYHKTKSVKFYNYDIDRDRNILIHEVPIADIEKNNYSLNYAEYMKDFINVNNAFELKTLGEICEINYGTRITKKKSEKGIYPVYGSGRATFTTNKFNREGFNILIGRFALSEECVRFTNEKLFLNDSGLSINTNYDKILHKYLCYYLIYNQNLIYNLARGTAQKNLNIEEFKLLQIPIPSLEKQNKIVNYLDLIESSNNLSNSKIESLKECNKFYIDGQIEIFSTEKINLGELCEINKGSLQSTKNIEGEYTFITASDEYKTHNKFTHDCECVMLVGGAEGSLAKSHYFKGKFIASDLLFILTSINENEINYKYLWYYLNFNKETHILDKNICCGTPKKMISKERCGNIKIPILSLDMQNEIVRYCDDNNSLVQKLEEEIEKNKKQANLYLKNILQIQPQIEPETDSQEAESEASSEAASEAASSSKCEADD